MIVEKILQDVDDLILAQSDLFGLAVRMLDDRDIFTIDYLTFSLDHARPSDLFESDRSLRRQSAHGNQGKIQRLTREEERVGIE